MARIRHIAISTDDPAKTAEFYKKFLGLTELYRKPADTGATGVWLSDGYIYFAVVKYGAHNTPNLGYGPSSITGINHIGFIVDDLEQARSVLKAGNVSPYVHSKFTPEKPKEKALILQFSKAENLKYIGPDGVIFDVRDRGWDDAIKANMQLYKLTPET